MSCFPNVKWPSCHPNAAAGVYECAPGIDPALSCCLSPQVKSNTISNCPAGWQSNPAAGEWCTDVQGISSSSMYRHKCKKMDSIKCVNPLLDSATNCRTCVDPELDPRASPPCSKRMCSTCQAGQTYCGTGCINTQTDNANCGACGVACGPGQACSQGMCAATCGRGMSNCAGVCMNTQTDNANCGACGMACGPGQRCSQGQCGTCA